MKKELNIYIDMDDVLADFNGEINAVKRFENEINFFYNLKPILDNVVYVNSLVKKGYNINILSASPNNRADNDKLNWLKKYLPCINNIIIMRNGENKADFVKTKGINILFDDYGKNCNDFINRGYMAYKVDKDNNIKKLFERLSF